MPPSLIVQRRDAVARLQLDRPLVHNAFDGALVADLTAALQEIAADRQVRVVVLAGSGASFSAGADLNAMRAIANASEADNREDARALARLMETLDTLPKPTIARVHGAAYGGGVGLVACCDIAIGTPAARFGLSEAKLGLLPAVISPYVVAAIGPRQARRYFATAETFDAAQALHIGLLHEVVEADQLDARIDTLCKALLACGPHATATAKHLVHRAAAGRDDAANADLIAQLRASDEGREGIGAFLDKRPAAWTPTVRADA